MVPMSGMPSIIAATISGVTSTPAAAMVAASSTLFGVLTYEVCCWCIAQAWPQLQTQGLGQFKQEKHQKTTATTQPNNNNSNVPAIAHLSKPSQAQRGLVQTCGLAAGS